jgi:hypothetical protein
MAPIGAMAMPMIDRHQPVDNKASFLPDSIDYTTAFPVMSAVVVIGAIVIGVGFLKKTNKDIKPSARAQTQIEQQWRAIYSQSNEPEAETDAGSSYEGTPVRTAEYVPKPQPRVPVSSGSAYTGPSRQHRKPFVRATFVAMERPNREVAIDGASITYSEDLGGFIGTVTVHNGTRVDIVDFSMRLMVDDASYGLLPFTGRPTKPEPITNKGIRAGGTLTCPVMAFAPEPDRNAVKIVKFTARVNGVQGQIALEVLVP